MEEEEFEKLTLEEKGEIVFTIGTFLSNRVYYNYKINLYALDKNYVEVFYSPNDNFIEKISFITREEVLKFYLSKININFLK